jgi:hypothetical protein
MEIGGVSLGDALARANHKPAFHFLGGRRAVGRGHGTGEYPNRDKTASSRFLMRSVRKLKAAI